MCCSSGDRMRNGEWMCEGSRAPMEERITQRPVDRSSPDAVAEADVDEILAVLGHELNAPLTTARGFAELLDEVADDPDDVREVATAIVRNIDLARALLARLRDSHRADDGSLRLQREPVDVVDLVSVTVDDLCMSYLADHPTRVHAPEAGTVTVDADPDRLRQVLVNLLTNAAKYSPPEAPVNVTVRTAGDQVEIEVRNHGMGVAPDEVEHLFQKYTYARDTDRTGLGLGLYLARTIARAHGGELRGEPAEGGGSTFVISLPRARP